MSTQQFPEENKIYSLTSEEVENIFNAISKAQLQLATGTDEKTVFKCLKEDIKYIISDNDIENRPEYMV